MALPRAVWLLGWVSLATDAASEAIYPLIPFYLTQVLHAGAVSLGVVEGAAEAANSLLKIISGRVADRSPAKRPLVVAGYSISSLARPLIAITRTWPQVFVIRVTDRVGKGVRGAPRDAMLASLATDTTRGKVFGFHRAMDHMGAVIGPALATAFLFFYPNEYRTLFALTIVPGATEVALILFVPEPVATATKRPAKTEHVAASVDDARLPARFHRFIGVVALFMLGNSSDTFLLLRLSDAAGGVRYVPLMWAALHVVKASVSVAAGDWSDRAGRRMVITIGWITYAVVYAGFATSSGLPALLAWFLVYGFYFGFAEGTEKALVADLAPVESRGTAFGVYTAVQGLGALAASILFGLIWNAYGPPVAFGFGSGCAIVATVLLLVLV